MEPLKVKKPDKVRLNLTELPDRNTPSVTLDVLGLVTADIHLDLQANITTPVTTVDLNLSL
jgi:hypothetical protein